MANTTTFSWRNYFRATPANLEQWSEGLHGLLVTIVATAKVQGGNPDLLFWLLLSGYGLDKLTRFFGRVKEDMEHVTVQVEGKELAVTDVTKDTPPEGPTH